MQSVSTLRTAQQARRESLPEQLNAPSPDREALLEAWRQRNAALDGLFYDLSVLTEAEARDLAPRYAAEGSILCVAPAGGPRLRFWSDHTQFDAEGGAPGARALVVAGVGSSALGAAAFARNVADALGAPVLAVVSGYGLADLLSEAVGGFFWFGMLNSLRHLAAPVDDLTRPVTPHFTGDLGQILSAVRGSLDVKTVIALLAHRDFDLLAGHSKGNLVLSEALFALAETDPARSAALARTTRLITVSAKIAMPRPWRDIVDVMGTLDGFGWMNSRADIPTDVRVPMAWHHTNTDLPFHLPVTATLRPILHG